MPRLLPGLVALCCVLPLSVAAATLTAQKDLHAGTVLAAGHVALDLTRDGDIDDPRQAIGRQLRRTVYAGQPIPANALGTPTIVNRNQIVSLAFSRGGLTIETPARALDAGAAGDTIRVLNTASRVTVTGVIAADGRVLVEAGQ